MNNITKNEMKKNLKRIPLLKNVISLLRYTKVNQNQFVRSNLYWEERYQSGGTSGTGSYGKFAEFKAEFLNQFVIANKIGSIIEFGCGDGNQLKLVNYPNYIGFDVSEQAILLCRKQFYGDTTKNFYQLTEYNNQRAELVLSLDVIYHLVEDEIFDSHMTMLFHTATRYVIIYSSNFDDSSSRDGKHIRHRKFTDWITVNCPNWKMIDHIPNKYPFKGDYKEGSFADFFVFSKVSS